MTATHGEGAYGNAVGVTNPTAHKMAQTTEFVKTTTANVIRPGLFYNGTTTIVSGKANMSYDVAAFSIVTQRSATAGVMKWSNDSTVNVTTTAAPGSNSRYDVVYAWHREYALDGTNSDPVIGVVQGTAAASPSVPSLSAYPGAVELARILVPAGVTATNSGTTITQTAPFTTSDGGVVPFRTKTEIDGWTTALTHQRARDLATGVLYVWNGSAWKAWESDWISYTPTTTNLTIGASPGGMVGKYRWTQGYVEVDIHVLLGTGLSVGAVSFSTPVTLANPWSSNSRFYSGETWLWDEGVGSIPGVILLSSTGSTFLLRYWGSLTSSSPLSSTTPFTWVAGDRMLVHFIAEPA